MNAPDAALAHMVSPRWSSSSFWRDLGAPFAVPQRPQSLPSPHWVATSGDLAHELGLDAWLGSEHALQMLAGNDQPPTGTFASVYSGHQFGVWAGQLGDGRALSLGDVESAMGRMELQLKGAGRTPYSRMGDGRAVLRSSIREFLCSEAMHGLGIPTTRALAIVGSPQPVRREELETAAVVTRVAPSFLRFGHFEHFTHTEQDIDALRQLTDAAMACYFPDQAAAARPYTALLREVSLRTARLLAQWQSVGFCHGVMNTDNLSLLGLTIDYGPFGFLDGFDPGHVCNHSDHEGRYAYARQPNVAFWNLHALAHALLPLIAEDGEPDEQTQAEALEAVAAYQTEYTSAMLARWRAKLGLRGENPQDRELADDWLRLMASERSDFTLSFRRLAGFDSSEGATNQPQRDHFLDRERFDAWALRYRARLLTESSVDAERAVRMNGVNPLYVLRNHLAELAIRSAREGDFSAVRELHAVLRQPYVEQPGRESYAALPPDWSRQLEISCSS